MTRDASVNPSPRARSGPTAAPIESYLDLVAGALPGPTRARTDIIAELRGGLFDAADAHQRAGQSLRSAAQAAVAEFGDPVRVAASFRPELATRQARRVAVTLLATGPFVGLLWLVAAHASNVAVRRAPPWDWAGLPPGSAIAFPLLAGALLITLSAALVTVATTGHSTRWICNRPRLVTTTAALAGFGATTVDVSILVLLTSQLSNTPTTFSPLPVVIAAAGSAIRISLASRAGLHCLATRASLTSSE